MWCCLVSVDNKTPWGINIMKKSKKADNPKAFGVRLENCQQAEHHKVKPTKKKKNSNKTVK